MRVLDKCGEVDEAPSPTDAMHGQLRCVEMDMASGPTDEPANPRRCSFTCAASSRDACRATERLSALADEENGVHGAELTLGGG